jgi:low affinity Fe/Cu permease
MTPGPEEVPVPLRDSKASAALHWLQELSARAGTAAVAAVASGVVLLTAARSSDDRILAWFEGVASAVTLVMVFALQHTQTREQAALQRKLDELIRALPGADPRLVQLEERDGSDIAAMASHQVTSDPELDAAPEDGTPPRASTTD